jgi:tRNA modification GTPase
MPAALTHTVSAKDTIAAIATPPGVAGIAVIRLSGPDSIAITNRMFDTGKDLKAQGSHTAHYGIVRGEAGEQIDDVLVTLFHAPHSYTSEETVEISCHGGTVVSRAVLERCIALGARSAEPGEFTRRAFLNGRLDLAQAEAVADIIHAQSKDAHSASVRQLEGKLSHYVGDMRSTLIDLASMLELSLDFAEEDVELYSSEKLVTELEITLGKLRKALDTYSSGKIIRDGVRTVIIGKPNSGKSSLLNALLNTNRAIVTDVPGTTRDYIEESAMINGELFRFIDTAGLRETQDEAELLGIEFGKEMLQSADITCCLVDVSDERLSSDDINAIKDGFKDAGVKDDTAIFVANKIDLVLDDSRIKQLQDAGMYSISALHGQGMDGFKQAIGNVARNLKQGHQSGEVLVTNIRHAQCLKLSIGSLERAIGAVTDSKTEEVLAFEVRQAIESLGEIIGEVVTDDILNSIFSRFCIGK